MSERFGFGNKSSHRQLQRVDLLGNTHEIFEPFEPVNEHRLTDHFIKSVQDREEPEHGKGRM